MVVPLPLYAVEKLAKLFFSLLPSVCTFSLHFLLRLLSFLFAPCNARKREKGWLVFIERWAKAGVVGGRGETEEDAARTARGGCVYIEVFPFPRYPSIPRRTSFVTQSKLSFGVVIKSLSAGYLDISRSGKMFRVRVIVRGSPTEYPAC